MSEVYRVTFATPSHPSQSLVAKIGNVMGANMIQPYKTELEFYQKAQKQDYGIRVPAFYHGAVSPDSKQMVLLLEEMTEPYVCGDQLKGDTYEQALLSVAALAGFHAATWHCHPDYHTDDPSREQAVDGKVGQFKEHSLLQTLSAVASSSWAAVARQVNDGMLDLSVPASHTFPARTSQEVADVMATVTSCIQQAQPSHLSGPTCLVHGDFRPDNITHAAGQAPCVLDFQVVHFGSPMEDIAYYVASGLEVEVRRQHLDSLLRHYHASLVSHGVSDYSFEDAMADFRKEAIFTGTMPALLGTRLDRLNRTGGTDRSTSLCVTIIRRTSAFLADMDVTDLMAEMMAAASERERPYPELDEEMATRVEMYKMMPGPDFATATAAEVKERMNGVVKYYREKEAWVSIGDVTEGTIGSLTWRAFFPASSATPSSWQSVVQWVPDSWISGDLGYNEINIRSFCSVVGLPVVAINTRSVTDVSLADLLADQKLLFDALSSGAIDGLTDVSDVHLLGYGHGGHTAVQLIPQVTAASLTLVSPFLKSSACSESIKACGDRYACFTGISEIKWAWDLAMKHGGEQEVDGVTAARDNVSSFPKTLVVYGEYDPLASEAKELLHVLEEGGVAASAYMAPGCTYSFLDVMYAAGTTALKHIAATHLTC